MPVAPIFPSNTAMRGFGYPQALLILESILDHVADSLRIEKMLVQELNKVEVDEFNRQVHPRFIQHLSVLSLDMNEKMLVQELNFLRDGDYFVYREKAENCTIRRCWSTLKEKCEYEKRKVKVDEFNR